MKISNETKVGALTALAITLLILGFNFLKGKSIFKSGNFIYAKYKNTKGIMSSNPVFIKGLQVGSVYDLEEANKNLDEIIVSVKLSKEVNIPRNSVATISASPLGTTTMEITLGTGTDYLKSGDTVQTADNPGALADITQRVQPVVDQVKVTLGTMDSVLRNMNSIFDPYTKNNMQTTVANMSRAMASLVVSSAYIEKLLNTQTGALAGTLNNVNAFTHNLAANNEKINGVLTNLNTVSSNFTKADIQGTIAQLQTTVAKLNSGIEKINSKDGSIGLLLNDKQLYTNLANTTRSVNILLDDLRVNPKRYTNISVSLFGKKNNTQPLMSPLPVSDTVITAGTQ